MNLYMSSLFTTFLPSSIVVNSSSRQDPSFNCLSRFYKIIGDRCFWLYSDLPNSHLDCLGDLNLIATFSTIFFIACSSTVSGTADFSPWWWWIAKCLRLASAAYSAFNFSSSSFFSASLIYKILSSLAHNMSFVASI